MSKPKNYLCFLMLSLALFACSEVIDLDVDETGGQLIIFGRVSNSSEGNYVSVHRTGDLGGQPVPVSNAQVTITNGSGDLENLMEAEPGRYELAGDVLLRVPGQQYALEVSTGGKTYHTELQEMPQNYGEDQLSFELTERVDITSAGVTIKEDVVNVSGRTEFEELPEEFYLRWDIEEAYTYLGTFLPSNHFPLSGGQVQCYVINSLNEQTIFLHNGKVNRAGVIADRLFVSRRVDKSFQTLHYFNVTRSSLSKETYEYWSKLSGIVNRQGSIFDTPAAPVLGNIIADEGDETVLGFFEVIAVDITRLALTRNDVPVFLFDECEKRGQGFAELFTVPVDCRQCLIDEGIVAPQCLQCDVLPGSSRIRPAYF